VNENFKESIIVIIGMIALVSVIAMRHLLDKVTTREPELSLLYLPDKQLIHAFALGDDAAGADLLWLRGVFYIAANSVEEKQEEFQHNLKNKAHPSSGGKREVIYDKTDFRNDPTFQAILFWNLNGTEAPLLLGLADRVTDLDPGFVTPYVYAATSLALFYGRYKEARQIIDKGVLNCPNSWEPLYHRGFLRLFYENDKVGAAEDIRRAAMIPGAPIIVVQLAAALGIGAGQRDVALDFLRSLREITTDDVLKQKIDDMLKVYGEGTQVVITERKTDVKEKLNSMFAGDSLR